MVLDRKDGVREGETLCVRVTGPQEGDTNLSYDVQWQPTENNRMIHQVGSEGFCTVSFANVPPRTIVKILSRGIGIGGSVFRFIGHSNSQLKEKRCWLYRGTLNENEDLLDSVGFFKQINPAAKRAKRIGLLFTTLEKSITISGTFDEVQDEDIDHSGFCFTDGCGRLSTAFAKRITFELDLHDPISGAPYRPSVFQIRFKGYKGVCVQDPCLRTERSSEVLAVRPSQMKFRLADGSDKLAAEFGIVDQSKPYQMGALNQSYVMLLAGLGVSAEVFKQRQQVFFVRWEAAMGGDPEAVFQMLMAARRFDLLRDFVCDDGTATASPDLAKRVKAALGSQLHKLRNSKRQGELKLWIPVEESRLLFGVADTTSTLKYGECFLQLEALGVPAARVLVTRSPCYHPGDIRVLRALPAEALVARAGAGAAESTSHRLAALRDVLVLPTKGDRPHADEMSGGDLDGDQFFVCWDKELVPKHCVQPASYKAGASQEESLVGLVDLAAHFAHFSFGPVSRVTRAWLYWAAREKDGALSTKCRRLNDLHSRAVDAVSTGEAVKLPADLQPTEDEPEHSTVWGELLARQEDWLSHVVRCQRGMHIDRLCLPRGALVELLQDGPLPALARLALLCSQRSAEEPLSPDELAAAMPLEELRPHERQLAQDLFGIPAATWPQANAMRDTGLLLPDHLADLSVGGPSAMGAPQCRWQQVGRGCDSGGMLVSLLSPRPWSKRTLLILKVRPGFTMAVLLIGSFHADQTPLTNNRQVSQDAAIGVGGRRAIVFGLTSSYRKKVEMPVGYRLCLCRDHFQLYRDRGRHMSTKEAVGGTTFVYLSAPRSFQPPVRLGKGGKGSRAGPAGGHGAAQPQAPPPESRVSVALENFDARGQVLFGGRVTKMQCGAWEVYAAPEDWSVQRPAQANQLLRELYLGRDPNELQLPRDDVAGDSDLDWLLRLYPEPEELAGGTVTSAAGSALAEQPILALERIAESAASHGAGALELYKTVTGEVSPAMEPEELLGLCASAALDRLLSNGALSVKELPSLVLALVLEVTSACAPVLQEPLELAITLAQRWSEASGAVMPVREYEQLGMNLCRNLPGHGFLAPALLRLGAALSARGAEAAERKQSFSVAMITQLLVEWARGAEVQGRQGRKGREWLVGMSTVAGGSGTGSGRGTANKPDKNAPLFMPTFIEAEGVPVVLKCIEDADRFDLGEGDAFMLEPELPERHLPVMSSRAAQDLYETLVAKQRRGRLRPMAVGSVTSASPDTAAVVVPAQMHGRPWATLLHAIQGVWWHLRVLPSFSTAQLCIEGIRAAGEADPDQLAARLFTALATGHELCGSTADLTTPARVLGDPGSSQDARNDGLNTAQRRALQAAMASELTAVQGPPGTGKTRLIATMVRHLLGQSSPKGSCLLLAETNFAVDNLAHAVHRSCPEAKLARVGPACSSEARRFEIDFQAKTKARREGAPHWQKVRTTLLKDAHVILSTCVRGAALPKELGKHLPVIVDEASQAGTPALLAALARQPVRIVLVGDDKQLGPVCVLDPTDVEELNRLLPERLGPEHSAFEWLLRQGLPSVMLTEQHRMNPELAVFPSQHFYGGQLISAVTASDRQPPRGVPWPVPDMPLLVLDTSADAVALEAHREQRVGSSWCNEGEAWQVAEISRAAQSAGDLDMENIGIITPYAGQVHAIKKHCAAGAEVSSVDAFQGREKELIIFSAVRSSSRLGFVANVRRMNVLLTRARRGLAIVGSAKTLATDPTWRAWLDWARSRHCVVLARAPKSAHGRASTAQQKK